VLVPTLVEKPGGGVVTASSRRILCWKTRRAAEDSRARGNGYGAGALVVAVELAAPRAWNSINWPRWARCWTFFLSDGMGQAALVGFDSKPVLIRDSHTPAMR